MEGCLGVICCEVGGGLGVGARTYWFNFLVLPGAFVIVIEPDGGVS